jgi:hypothetical protein
MDFDHAGKIWRELPKAALVVTAVAHAVRGGGLAEARRWGSRLIFASLSARESTPVHAHAEHVGGVQHSARSCGHKIVAPDS